MSAGAVMVSVNAFVVARAALSCSRTVKLDAPAAAGVPPIAPVDAFSERPAGSDPALTDQASGAVPPELTKVCE